MVHLAVDDEGDPVTSCVVSSKPASRRARSQDKKRSKSRGERALLAAFYDLESAGEAISAPGPGGELGKRASLDALEGAFKNAYAVGPDVADPAESKRKEWDRIQDKLPVGFVASDDGSIWRSDDPFQ